MSHYIAPCTSEKVIQRDVVQLLRSVGAAVYVLGTVRPRGDWPGTRQTPGLPDVLCFLPARYGRPVQLLVLELKAVHGRLSGAQRVFKASCEQAGVAHVAGGLDAVIAWLAQAGYVREDRHGD